MTPYSASASVVINSNLEKVWDAITNPVQVKKYFFGTDLDTTWEVGKPIYWRGNWNGRQYEDKGTVLSFRKPHYLEFDYFSALSGNDDSPENYQVISFELNEVDGGVDVKILQKNAPSQESADHSIENWEKVLIALKDLVEKGE
jgi:uncharacterized protein YndB with AHSA1/START domain